MNKLFSGAIAIALATLGTNAVWAEDAPAETGPFASDNFSSTLYLSNQYMFRGISNTDGGTVQGSVDWGYNGWFVGAWASNTEFSDSNFEIDYYGGYRWSWSGLDFTLQGIYYSYPGEDENGSDGLDPGFGVEADYGELNVGIGHVFPGQLAPSIAFNYYFSPDAFGEDGNAHTFQGSFGLTLPGEFGLYANVGYSDTEGDKSSGAQNGIEYTYFSVGVNKVIKGFKFDVAYHGTDESSSLESFYPPGPVNSSGDSFRDLIEGYPVFTLSRSF